MYKRTKNVLFYLLMVCCGLITGCSRANYGDKILANAKRIKLGMEKKEVIGILGLPRSTFPDIYEEDNIHRETLFYPIQPRCLTGDSDRRPTDFIVSMESNRVWYTSYIW